MENLFLSPSKNHFYNKNEYINANSLRERTMVLLIIFDTRSQR